MRVAKKHNPDYGAISRRSVRSDFYREKIYLPEQNGGNTGNSQKISPQPENGDVRRVVLIGPNCEYLRFSKYFVGKLMRLEERTGVKDSTTGWYSFVHDEDREALNQAAGWTTKKRYLLVRPKFK